MHIDGVDAVSDFPAQHCVAKLLAAVAKHGRWALL